MRFIKNLISVLAIIAISILIIWQIRIMAVVALILVGVWLYLDFAYFNDEGD